MHLHALAEPFGRLEREREPVALDHDVQIEVLAPEQHIAHEPAHGMRPQPGLVGKTPDRADRFLRVFGQQRERAEEATATPRRADA